MPYLNNHNSCRACTSACCPDNQVDEVDSLHLVKSAKGTVVCEICFMLVHPAVLRTEGATGPVPPTSTNSQHLRTSELLMSDFPICFKEPLCSVPRLATAPTLLATTSRSPTIMLPKRHRTFQSRPVGCVNNLRERWQLHDSDYSLVQGMYSRRSTTPSTQNLFPSAAEVYHEGFG